MEPRRKHQINLCGTQDAASCVYDTDEGLVNPTNPFEARPAYNKPFSRPLVSHLQPVDAQRLARNRSSKIFSSFNELRDILERHEATIQKRWRKKSNKQRQAILLKAWPTSKFFLIICTFSWVRKSSMFIASPTVYLQDVYLYEASGMLRAHVLFIYTIRFLRAFPYFES